MYYYCTIMFYTRQPFILELTKHVNVEKDPGRRFANKIERNSLVVMTTLTSISATSTLIASIFNTGSPSKEKLKTPPRLHSSF
jgi:hypothetical protein